MMNLSRYLPDPELRALVVETADYFVSDSGEIREIHPDVENWVRENESVWTDLVQRRGFRLAHFRKVEAIARFAVGDLVAVSPAFGKHCLAGVPGRVLRVDLDHSHASPCCWNHPDECYVEEKVGYTVVWPADVSEGSTPALRATEPGRVLQRVQ